MPVVHIPAAMRSVTAEQATVTGEGATVAELIDNLEVTNPGLKARLVDEDRLRSNIALFVDGAQVNTGLRTKVDETSEIYFALAIAGGTG